MSLINLSTLDEPKAAGYGIAGHCEQISSNRRRVNAMVGRRCLGLDYQFVFVLPACNQERRIQLAIVTLRQQPDLGDLTRCLGTGQVYDQVRTSVVLSHFGPQTSCQVLNSDGLT